jgi:hypothetical protein
MLHALSSLVAVAVNLRPTVRQPVYPGVRRPSGTCNQFFFLLEISFRQLRVCNFVAPSLTRGRVCKLLYNCFWALPEQSLLGEVLQNSRPYFTVSSETVMYSVYICVGTCMDTCVHVQFDQLVLLGQDT